jgi:hypothetical protein
VVLEKDVKDELDRSCKKRSFIESWGRKEISYVQQKGGRLSGFFHTLRRNCILIQVTEGNIGQNRWARKRKHLLDGSKEMKSCWKFKWKSWDHTVCWTRFGRSYWPVVREAT